MLEKALPQVFEPPQLSPLAEDKKKIAEPSANVGYFIVLKINYNNYLDADRIIFFVKFPLYLMNLHI